MNSPLGKRYVPSSQIFSLHTRALHYGEDLFLHREVLLYTTQCPAWQSSESYVLKFRNKTYFNHKGFHHILDISFDERSVMLVLQLKPGKLFPEELHTRTWTFSNVISLVTDLGVSMLDAMEHNITGFSIGTENLWLGVDGHLSIINYWDEGKEPQTQGVIGLCGLLIQLLSGETEMLGPYDSLHTHLERIPIPTAAAEQKDELVKLIKLVCQGQASLSTFIFGLKGLQHVNTTNEATKEAGIPLSSPVTTDTSFSWFREEHPATMKGNQSNWIDDSDVEKNPARMYKRIGLGAITFIITAFLIWILWLSPKHYQDVPTLTPTDSTNSAQKSSPTITSDPQKSIVQEPGSGQNKEVTIPNLIGMTQADAEKQALSSRLHYNYFLEANQQTKGSVFKQDPQPGTKGSQGDTVTFWVSKGP